MIIVLLLIESWLLVIELLLWLLLILLAARNTLGPSHFFDGGRLGNRFRCMSGIIFFWLFQRKRKQIFDAIKTSYFFLLTFTEFDEFFFVVVRLLNSRKTATYLLNTFAHNDYDISMSIDFYEHVLTTVTHTHTQANQIET